MLFMWNSFQRAKFLQLVVKFLNRNIMKITILGNLISAFILIACGIAAGQTEIKVGIAGPLSGSTLALGEQQEVGAQKAFEHLNDQGGLFGKEIVVISVDDACEDRQARSVARQLVSEGVILVIGHLCSGCTIATRKIYEEAVLFLNEKFIRLTETEKDGTAANTYYDMAKIDSVRTLSPGDKA